MLVEVCDIFYCEQCRGDFWLRILCLVVTVFNCDSVVSVEWLRLGNLIVKCSGSV